VSISLPTDIDLLKEEMTKIGAALISVDPVMSVLSNALDTHKDREVGLGLEPLGKFADETGCVVLGNAHFNKSSGSDPLSLIMGSAAFGNVARAALGFARDADAEDGSCVISQIKNNLGRLDLPSLRYRIEAVGIDTDEGPTEIGKLVMLGESDRSVADILRDRGGRDSDGARDVDEWLTEYLQQSADQSANAKDVIRDGRALGFSEDVVKKARMRIKAKSQRHGFGKGAWIEWPIGAIDAIDATPTSMAPTAPMDANAAVCLACSQPIGLPNPRCSLSGNHESAEVSDDEESVASGWASCDDCGQRFWSEGETICSSCEATS
jgi:hypothetical protein